MFSLDYLEKQLMLTPTYRHIAWESPPVMPGVIEFLDQQNTLVYGVVYVSPEEYVAEFFGQGTICVYPGAVLLVSNASKEIPRLPEHVENLSVIGFAETLGRLYNRLITYIEAPSESDSSVRFSEVWGEIMSHSSMTIPEIREKLRKVPGLVEPFVQVGVAVFNKPQNFDIPYKRIMRQLKALIPNCTATVHNKEIIMLITYTERQFNNPYDLEQITKVLEKYDGYMGISNGTRLLNSLKGLYQLTSRIITLACEMKISAPDRIFPYERLGTFAVIDLCARAFYEHIDDGDIMFLAHPAIIALTRYDHGNNDNLREVLYFYLLNDRSIANTASAIFMHRNTVMNKVRKINQLLGLDLEDGHLRQRLMFSCQLIHYYEDVVKGKIRL